MNNSSFILNTVVWEITLQCNLHCKHCGSSASTKTARNDELDLNESLQLIKEISYLGGKVITLSGGEPFLSTNWFEIASSIIDLNIDLRFVSNGTLITNNIIKKLLSLQKKPRIGISLDGGNQKTHDDIRSKNGVFQKALNAIINLSNNNFPITVITSVQKKNINELEDIYNLIRKFNHVTWQIQPAMPSGRMEGHKDMVLDIEDFSEIANFISFKKKNSQIDIIAGDNIGYFSSAESSLRSGLWTGCQAGISAVGIRSNGDIVGCLSLQESSPEGNIRKKSLVDIWNDQNLFTYNRAFTIHDLGENCSRCHLGEICKGGCTFLSYSYTKSYHNSPMCLKKHENLNSRQYIII